MALHFPAILALLFSLEVCQPTTLLLSQTLSTHPGANSTITGPIFVGPTLSDGIVTGYASELSYWVKNSSGSYALNQSWTPLNISFADLATEYNYAQGFGAAAMGNSTIFELNSGVYGPPNQTFTFSNTSTYNITVMSWITMGNKLITGNSDGSIDIWNLDYNAALYNPQQKLTGHTSAIKQLAVGSLYTIISLSSNGEVFDWEYDQSTDSYTLTPGPTLVNASAVGICTDGDMEYYVGLTNGSIVSLRWGSNQKQFAVYRTYNGDHTSPVDSIAFSRTCDRIVTTADNLLLWNFNYTSLGYDQVKPATTGYDPARVTQSPSEIAVAVNNTGQYKIYSIVLNCSNVANAASQLNSTTCNCKENYIWTYEYCYQINCSSLDHATTIFNATTCNCADNYTWNFFTLACEISCQNRWMPVDGQCKFDCSHVQYAKNGDPTTNGKCECATGYQWDNTTLQCLSEGSSSSSSKLAIGLGVGLGVGIPALAGLITLLCCWCSQSAVAVPPAITPIGTLPPGGMSTTHLVSSVPAPQFVNVSASQFQSPAAHTFSTVTTGSRYLTATP